MAPPVRFLLVMEMVPTWQDAGGGGGEYDFVASGNIANGDTVIVNSNGTVSVIAESGAELKPRGGGKI